MSSETHQPRHRFGGVTLDGTLAARVNQEPLIFKGCTSSELNLLFMAAMAFWLPVLVIVGLIGGNVTLMIGVAFALGLVSVYLGAAHFQQVKRNRPDGFYAHKIALTLQRWRLRYSGFDLPDGRLALGRTIGGRGAAS